MEIKKVEIESCEAEFRDGVDFYFFPGWLNGYAEGGRKTAVAALPEAKLLRTLTIIFRHNDALCVKALRVTAANGKVQSLVFLGSERANAPAKEVLFNGGQASRSVSAVPPPQGALRSAETAVDALSPAARVATAFNDKEYRAILDRELFFNDDGKHWLFRLRSDGSFFMRGHHDVYTEAQAFSAIGRFAVERSKAGAVVLRIVGRRFTTPQPWDGSVCPQDCEESGEPLGTYVNEEISIRDLGKGQIQINNWNAPGKRSLPFSGVKVRRTSLQD